MCVCRYSLCDLYVCIVWWFRCHLIFLWYCISVCVCGCEYTHTHTHTGKQTGWDERLCAEKCPTSELFCCRMCVTASLYRPWKAPELPEIKSVCVCVCVCVWPLECEIYVHNWKCMREKVCVCVKVKQPEQKKRDCQGLKLNLRRTGR